MRRIAAVGIILWTAACTSDANPPTTAADTPPPAPPLPLTSQGAPPSVSAPSNATATPLTVSIPASVPSRNVYAGQPPSPTWNFNEPDGPPTGWTDAGGENVLTVYNSRLSTNNSTDPYRGATTHTVDLSGDWELIFDYDAIGGTNADDGGFALYLLNGSDLSGWGVFMGDYPNPVGGDLVWHIQRIDAGGATHTNVTNNGGHPTSGTAKLDYNSSTDVLRLGYWTGSRWIYPTNQSWDASSDTQYAGDAGGGLVYVWLQSDTSPTDEVWLDNIDINGSLDAMPTHVR